MTGPSADSRKANNHKEKTKSGRLAWISAASISGHLKSCNSGCYPQRLNALWTNQLPPRLMFTGAQWSFKTPDLTKFPRSNPASLHDRTKCILSKTDSTASENTTKTQGVPCTPRLWLIWFSLSESVDSPQRSKITTRSKAVMWSFFFPFSRTLEQIS